MKRSRAVLAVGICFLFGMMFCCFLVTREPGSQNVAMNQAQPVSSLSSSVPDEFISGQVVRIKTVKRFESVIVDPLVFQRAADPNWWLQPQRDGKRHRIVPARGGATVDMIDLDYVPDFEIDLK